MSYFELRQASRSLLRQPGFTFLSVLLIALGVGAGTVVFTQVNDLLLTPPPRIVRPEQIVRLNEAQAGEIGAATYPDYSFYRAGARIFSDIFAYDPVPYVVQVRAGDNLDEA